MAEKINVNGTRLAVEVTGREGAPWIMLSNSLGTTWRMWDPQMPLLEPHFRVLRYDTRGHGASDAPRGPYTFPQLVGDVIGILDHYKIDRTDFMGLSIGGMTGLGLVLDHPDRINRLVCADARAEATQPFRQLWDERAAALDKGGTPAVWPGTRDRWFKTTTGEVLARFEKEYLAMPIEGLKGCGEALKTLDYLKDLGRIRTPTLYIGGDSDMGAPPEGMQAMTAATPGATYASVPNAAHIANVDNPAAFNVAIAKFLGIA